jgi:hypothetical protein
MSYPPKRDSSPVEKELALKPSAPTPFYRLFVGVASAYRDFTAALLVPGEKAKCEPKAFAQTAEGFAFLQQRLGASGLEPASILVVRKRPAVIGRPWRPHCIRPGLL